MSSQAGGQAVEGVELPEAIGGQRIVRLLGQGGMAQVFEAVQERESEYRKTVVVKRILPQHASDPEFVKWFLSEARISASLNHPKIVKVFDFGRDEAGVPYMVMEYVPGTDLAQLIKRYRQLPFTAIHAILHDIAEAFVYAHSAGPDRTPLVHRDFSPGNLLVRPDGTAILSDFGVSKPLTDPTTETKTDIIKGKLHFFAPETLTRKINDVRTDLFAIGVSLYQAVTGALPFDGDSHFLVLQDIVQGRRRPVLELRPDCPPALVEIIDRLLKIDPTERFQSAYELLSSLPPLPSTSRFELGRLVYELTDRRRSDASKAMVGPTTPAPNQESGPRPLSHSAEPTGEPSSPGSSSSHRIEDPAESDGRSASSPSGSDATHELHPERASGGDHRAASSSSGPRDVPTVDANADREPSSARSGASWGVVGVLAGALILVTLGGAAFAVALMTGGDEHDDAAASAPEAHAVAPEGRESTEAGEDDRAEPTAAGEGEAAGVPSPAEESADLEATANAESEPSDDGAGEDVEGEGDERASNAPTENGTAPNARPQPGHRSARRRPRETDAPAASSDTMDRARACLARGDQRCAQQVLEAGARTQAERALLIDIYRRRGRFGEMLDAMEVFVRRYPRAPQTPGYRADLRRYGR